MKFPLLIFFIINFSSGAPYLKSTVPTDHLDSVYIQKFLERYSEYSSYKERILKFYKRSKYKLRWFEDGAPISHASLFINVIENLDDYGLLVNSSPNYNIGDTLSYIEESALSDSPYDVQLRKSLDIALTAMFFKYFPALWTGVINPNTTKEIEWHLTQKKISYAAMLDSILNDSHHQNPFIDYRQFHIAFFQLKRILRQYNEIEKAGGWPSLTTQHSLAKGDTGRIISELANLLRLTGDLSDTTLMFVFDKRLKEAVINFQQRHGLKTDGIVGDKTLKALNVPVQERIKQILVNMERWRWVPPLTAEKYICVNIPEFKLYVYDNDDVALKMPVIVGKSASHTVVFNDQIKYIVLNPYWNIPRSIAVEEMLPAIQHDSLYFKKHDIEIGIDGKYEDMNQRSIIWQKVTPDNFDFTLRQRPGNTNQLGRIKFIFPNRFSIYLHDTPARNLFNERKRALSHGCIRVAKPYQLAAYLLKDTPKYSEYKIRGMTRKKTINNKWITLDEPFPVYILYFTVWVDGGKVQFREDIYGHDDKVIKRLIAN